MGGHQSTSDGLNPPSPTSAAASVVSKERQSSSPAAQSSATPASAKKTAAASAHAAPSRGNPLDDFIGGASVTSASSTASAPNRRLGSQNSVSAVPLKRPSENQPMRSQHAAVASKAPATASASSQKVASGDYGKAADKYAAADSPHVASPGKGARAKFWLAQPPKPLQVGLQPPPDEAKDGRNLEQDAIRLCVKNLSKEVTPQVLRQYFESHCHVYSAQIRTNKDGKSRGFGFVFVPGEHADRVVAEVNGKALLSTIVEVMISERQRSTGVWVDHSRQPVANADAGSMVTAAPAAPSQPRRRQGATTRLQNGLPAQTASLPCTADHAAQASTSQDYGQMSYDEKLRSLFLQQMSADELGDADELRWVPRTTESSLQGAGQRSWKSPEQQPRQVWEAAYDAEPNQLLAASLGDAITSAQYPAWNPSYQRQLAAVMMAQQEQQYAERVVAERAAAERAASYLEQMQRQQAVELAYAYAAARAPLNNYQASSVGYGGAHGLVQVPAITKPTAALQVRAWEAAATPYDEDATTTPAGGGIEAALAQAALEVNDMWEAIRRSGIEVYEGRLKSLSTNHGYGFISCEDTYKLHKRDIYIEEQDLPAGAKVGDALRFTVELSGKSHPRVAICTAVIKDHELLVRRKGAETQYSGALQ